MSNKPVIITPKANGAGALVRPWQPGERVNMAGRPSAARHKLSGKFVQDLLNDWEEHGPKTIKEVRATRPVDYLKVVAGILPKHFNIKVNEFDELSDEQLRQRLDALLAQLAAGGVSCGGRTGEEGTAKPPLQLPPIR